MVTRQCPPDAEMFTTAHVLKCCAFSGSSCEVDKTNTVLYCMSIQTIPHMLYV